MDRPINSTPPEEMHISTEELKAYIAGQVSDARAEEIARHLSQCDMCSDELEGLLDFDQDAGLQQTTQKMYADFSRKNLGKKRRAKDLLKFDFFNTTNTALLIIALVLLILIILSIYFLSRNPKKPEPNRNAESYGYSDGNSLDSMELINPEDSAAYAPFSPDSGDYDITLDNIMKANRNVNYDYYQADDASPTISYNPYDRYTSPIVVNSPKDEVTTRYSSKQRQDNDKLTPQNEYFGYNSDYRTAQPKKSTNQIRIGNQLIELDFIIDDAKTYYKNQQYQEGINFLQKYNNAISESIPDIDFWLGKMYIKTGAVDSARFYLERISGYDNPFRDEARQLLQRIP